MKDYLFVLGRDPKLSILELASYFKSRNINYSLKSYTDKIAVVSLQNLNSGLIKELGGTIKIAEVISSTNQLDEIEYYLNKSLTFNNKKLIYAISSYDTNLLSFVESYLKTRFKEEKIKATYLKPKRKFTKEIMPSKLISKNIFEKGFELIIYNNYITKTIAIFNPEEFKRRDLARPEKDYLKVISLRLAKILINLSQVKKDGTLLDPFCGVATILQESLLAGINVIGIDIEENSIKASENNLKWLEESYEIKNRYKLILADSRELTKYIGKDSIDAVVTEPYLGPYIKKLPLEEEVKNFINDLQGLYFDVLKELREVIKKTAKIVIIVPVFKTKQGKKITIEFSGLIKNLGFKIYSPLEEIKMPIRYSTQESKIERNIYILEK